MTTPISHNLILFEGKLKGTGFQQMSKQFKTTRQNLFSLKNLFTSFIGYDIYSSFRNLIPSLINTSRQLGAMKSRFNAVSTSASAGADELNWVGEQSKRLGLDFLKTADDYSIFFATVSKNMGQRQTREVFTSWAEAFRVLHIDPERQSRVLYALREMSSKGKIYMQDLALQLGSAVPDAMNIAAKSMGYTGPKAVERFREAIKAGEIDVKKFIPLFSEAVNKQYVSQKALDYAMRQTDAQLQTLATHWTFIQKNILEAGLQDDIIKFLQNTNKLLGWLEKHSKSIYSIFKTIIGILGFLLVGKAYSGLFKIVNLIIKFLPKLSSIPRILATLRGLFSILVGSPFAKLIFSILSKGGGIGWIGLAISGIGIILALIIKKFFPNVWKSLMAYWVLFQNLIYGLLDNINNHPAIQALKKWFKTDKAAPQIQLPKSLEQKRIEEKYPQYKALSTIAQAKDIIPALPFMPGGNAFKFPARILGAGLQQQVQNFFQPKNTINMTINSLESSEVVANEVVKKLDEYNQNQKKSFAKSVAASKNNSFNPLTPLRTSLGF